MRLFQKELASAKSALDKPLLRSDTHFKIAGLPSAAFQCPLKPLPGCGVRGAVTVPGDKSISHRAVILAALSNRMCTVDNFLEAEDCLCTLEAFRAMGVPIVRKAAHLQIHGQGLEG